MSSPTSDALFEHIYARLPPDHDDALNSLFSSLNPATLIHVESLMSDLQILPTTSPTRSALDSHLFPADTSVVTFASFRKGFAYAAYHTLADISNPHDDESHALQEGVKRLRHSLSKAIDRAEQLSPKPNRRKSLLLSPGLSPQFFTPAQDPRLFNDESSPPEIAPWKSHPDLGGTFQASPDLWFTPMPYSRALRARTPSSDEKATDEVSTPESKPLAGNSSSNHSPLIDHCDSSGITPEATLLKRIDANQGFEFGDEMNRVERLFQDDDSDATSVGSLLESFPNPSMEDKGSEASRRDDELTMIDIGDSPAEGLDGNAVKAQDLGKITEPVALIEEKERGEEDCETSPTTVQMDFNESPFDRMSSAMVDISVTEKGNMFVAESTDVADCADPVPGDRKFEVAEISQGVLNAEDEPSLETGILTAMKADQSNKQEENDDVVTAESYKETNQSAVMISDEKLYVNDKLANGSVLADVTTTERSKCSETEGNVLRESTRPNSIFCGKDVEETSDCPENRVENSGGGKHGEEHKTDTSAPANKPLYAENRKARHEMEANVATSMPENNLLGEAAVEGRCERSGSAQGTEVMVWALETRADNMTRKHSILEAENTSKSIVDRRSVAESTSLVTPAESQSSAVGLSKGDEIGESTEDAMHSILEVKHDLTSEVERKIVAESTSLVTPTELQSSAVDLGKGDEIRKLTEDAKGSILKAENTSTCEVDRESVAESTSLATPGESQSSAVDLGKRSEIGESTEDAKRSILEAENTSTCEVDRESVAESTSLVTPAESQSSAVGLSKGDEIGESAEDAKHSITEAKHDSKSEVKRQIVAESTSLVNPTESQSSAVDLGKGDEIRKSSEDIKRSILEAENTSTCEVDREAVAESTSLATPAESQSSAVDLGKGGEIHKSTEDAFPWPANALNGQHLSAESHFTSKGKLAIHVDKVDGGDQSLRRSSPIHTVQESVEALGHGKDQYVISNGAGVAVEDQLGSPTLNACDAEEGTDVSHKVDHLSNDEAVENADEAERNVVASYLHNADGSTEGNAQDSESTQMCFHQSAMSCKTACAVLETPKSPTTDNSHNWKRAFDAAISSLDNAHSVTTECTMAVPIPPEKCLLVSQSIQGLANSNLKEGAQACSRLFQKSSENALAPKSEADVDSVDDDSTYSSPQSRTSRRSICEEGGGGLDQILGYKRDKGTSVDCEVQSTNKSSSYQVTLGRRETRQRSQASIKPITLATGWEVDEALDTQEAIEEATSRNNDDPTPQQLMQDRNVISPKAEKCEVSLFEGNGNSALILTPAPTPPSAAWHDELPNISILKTPEGSSHRFNLEQSPGSDFQSPILERSETNLQDSSRKLSFCGSCDSTKGEDDASTLSLTTRNSLVAVVEKYMKDARHAADVAGRVSLGSESEDSELTPENFGQVRKFRPSSRILSAKPAPKRVDEEISGSAISGKEMSGVGEGVVIRNEDVVKALRECTEVCRELRNELGMRRRVCGWWVSWVLGLLFMGVGVWAREKQRAWFADVML